MVNAFLEDSAFWMGGLQSESPANNQYQKTSAVTQPTPEDSTSLRVCVCVDIHAQARASLPPRCIWIGWMAHRPCISVSLVLAGWQIMRQRLHCWHQMTLFNKRYRQSADPLPLMQCFSAAAPVETEANFRCPAAMAKVDHLKKLYSYNCVW